MKNSLKIIYAIPGLGTTKELFDNLSIPDHQIKVLTWPQSSKGENLEQYAMKFMDQLDLTAPVILLGVSFGGMICVELAHKIKDCTLLLISSCKNKKEFPLLFTFLKNFPIHALFSDKAMRWVAKKNYRWFGVPSSHKNAFYAMLDKMSTNYFAHCLPTLYNWKRTTTSTDYLHIHGTSDNVIPHHHIKNFVPITGGTHFMIVNRADEISRLLHKKLNGL